MNAWNGAASAEQGRTEGGNGNAYGTRPVTDGADPAGPDKAAETEPDARFTLANQRTFLAWSRTALALVAAGLGIVQLLPPFPHVPWGRRVIGVPLIVLGAVTAATAYYEWTKIQRALRRGDPLPRSALPLILAVTIGVVAAAAAAVSLISVTR
jgi:putative membrane protein